MTNIDELKNELNQRILFIDGAMGTMLQRYKLQEEDFHSPKIPDTGVNLKGDNDILSITKPEIVKEIHLKYLEAGADIIETNSFNANEISQADYKLQDLVYDINFQAAKIAVNAVREYKAISNKMAYVAGSIGPTNKTLSMSPQVNSPAFRAINWEQMYSAYKKQIKALIDGGVDIILIETVFDALNCKAAVKACNDLQDELNINIPVMISGTIADKSGRILSGQTLEAFYISVSHCRNLLSVGINCALGSKQMKPHIETLDKISEVYISLYPNAGLPNEFGAYDETACYFSDVIKEYAESGYLNIVGGCCGTTPEHIESVVEKISNIKPRQIKSFGDKLNLAGLEPLVFRNNLNFVNIGERTNVAGSAKFKQLIFEHKYEEALSVAKQQIEQGAQIIDISMDDAMLNGEEAVTEFLRFSATEPDIAKVPFMIDSSRWSIIEAALQNIQGKPIVNSISLKEGEEQFLNHAKTIKNYGAAVVVMAFDESGQADTFDRKIQVCQRAYNLLLNKADFKKSDIIFDPNILAIATGINEHNNYAVNYIEAVKWIKHNLPGVYVSGGVSNLSFSFRGNNVIRRAMHSVFLYHAIKAGMDMGIVNAGQIDIYQDIDPDLLKKCENLIFNKSNNATEELLEYAKSITSDKEHEEAVHKWRMLDLNERLKYSLVHGIVDYINEDTLEAVNSCGNDYLSIIEGPLMDGMNTVGELFGSGKMFLPQVIKSARVMKKSVEIIVPYLKQQNSDGAKSAGKILLATVKGDVHDIGKNIVAVVLACNNYEIIDLGVMVPAETIIEEALKNKVDIIGLSGLITPSLDEMENVAQKMKEHSLKIPLLIGGATTSKIHTAVKITPNYNKAIYVQDAGKSVPVVSNLLNKDKNIVEQFLDAIANEYDDIRNQYFDKKSNKRILSYAEARQNRLYISDFDSTVAKPAIIGKHVLKNYSLAEIQNYINWTQFFMTWGIKGKYPLILKNPKTGEEANKLFTDARKILEKIINDNLLRADAVFGIFPANSNEDGDIEVYDQDKTIILNLLRDQTKKEMNNYNYSLSDFIAPNVSGITDYVGAFALSCGHGMNGALEMYSGDDYSCLMIKILADRLAEAFAELLHKKVRQEYWKYEGNSESCDTEELFQEKYRGIRPAFGYPSLPDLSENKKLIDLLNVSQEINVAFTENYMMQPAASVSGLYFASPHAKYFTVSRIDLEQFEDYAARKSIDTSYLKKWLNNLIV